MTEKYVLSNLNDFHNISQTYIRMIDWSLIILFSSKDKPNRLKETENKFGDFLMFKKFSFLLDL